MKKMTKNIYSLLLSVSLVVAFSACSKNNDLEIEVSPVGNGQITETLTLTVDTKATLSDALETAWEDGDKIAVWTGTSESSGEFQVCTVASSSIEVTLNGDNCHRYNYAVHYCGETLPSYSAGTLSVNLPAEYEYAAVSGDKNPVPMVAKNLYTEGSALSFHAVGALARITLDGIPAATKTIKVTFDKDVTGSFAVSEPASAAPSIATTASSGNNVVSIVLPDYETNYSRYVEPVVNVPVPTGNISIVSIETFDGEDNLLATNVGSVISNWSAARTKGKKAVASFTPSFHNMIIAPGNLYTEGGVMRVSDCAYTNFYNGATDTYTDNGASYSAANRTFFLWNELYIMMSTGFMPSFSEATTNQSGSDLSAIERYIDGNIWHIGSANEYKQLFAKAGAPTRPGAYVEFTTAGENQKSKNGSRWTKVTLDDFDGETFGTGSSDADKAVKLRGIIIFPDNKSIKIDFVKYGGTLDQDNGKFEAKVISKAMLDDLIENQGCAFLPVGGFYYITNSTHMNWHVSVDLASASEDPNDDTKFMRFNLQNTAMSHAVSTDKTLHAHSVRLVRPVE